MMDISDTKGRTVDFRNTIIITTLNVGAQQLQDQRFAGLVVSVMEKIL
ncbi:hypothetical protein ACVXZ0_04475 [Staphylococcus aureus]